MPDAVNFTLLWAGYFCIFINIIELCYSTSYVTFKWLDPFGYGGTRALFNLGLFFATTGVKFETGPHTQRARREQTKRQAIPDW